MRVTSFSPGDVSKRLLMSMPASRGLLYRLCTVLVDASAQQKGSVSLVAVQEVPVELIARSAEFLAFRVEQVVAAYAFESRDAVQVFGRSDGESFDQL